MDKNIRFGFWNYVESGVFGKDVVKDWKAMGFHIPMSFDFDVEKHDKSQMLEILDECEKEGLQLIIRDKRTRFRTYIKKSREEFIAGVREAYADFGRHKGAFGFFAGDEPVRSEEQALIETIKILLEEMPGLVPFSNVFPYWSGSDFDMQTGRDSGYFKGTMEKILGESKTPIIAYDHYTQCLDENYNQETGINSYFYDLDSFHKVSKAYGIPFYLSALCVGHWTYRVPTEDDIRWQIYTALAHGARGIIWFHLYNVKFNGSSYRGAPFFGRQARHTETYEYMLRQQQIFNDNYKEIFDKIEMTEVYHTAHIYDPARRFCEDEYISTVNGKHSYPTIITYYKEMDSEEKWLSVVNAHQRYANHVTVNFKNGKELSCWLAPGEMKLVKLSDFFDETAL